MEIFVGIHTTIIGQDLIKNYPDKGALIVHLHEQARLADLYKELNLSNQQVNLVVINDTCFYTDPVLHQGDFIELFLHMVSGQKFTRLNFNIA
jgi:sulfur carrier protein ThiS